jgi:hypothetical protein
MDNPETFKNGQSRDIQEWTIQRHSRMDHPETFKNGQSRDIQEWTIQRHSQCWTQDTEATTKTHITQKNKRMRSS